MEAALRTAAFLLEGKELEELDFHQVRGLEGVKEASLEIAGREVRVAVAHWMSNIEMVLDRLRKSRVGMGEPYYHFIEVMACRGGCVGGGGQPYGATDEIRVARAKGLYRDDLKSEYRVSHKNPQIKALYDSFLGKPLGKLAHKHLHTSYRSRKTYGV